LVASCSGRERLRAVVRLNATVGPALTDDAGSPVLGFSAISVTTLSARRIVILLFLIAIAVDVVGSLADGSAIL
jgi:hypothetical protein